MKTSKLLFHFGIVNYPILLIVTFCLVQSGQLLAQGRVSSVHKILTNQESAYKPTSEERSGLLSFNEVYIYGGGALFGALTSEDEIEEKSSVSGSVGLNLVNNMTDFGLYFTYNARETVEINSLADFGNSLMNPNLSGHSLNLYLRTMPFKREFWKAFGFSGQMKVADNFWKTDSTTVLDASPLTLRIGLTISPFEISTNDTNNRLAIYFDVHYAHRAILGDFSNEDRRIDGYNVVNRGYNGFEFSVNVNLNSINFYVLYSLNSKGDYSIPSFTGNQVAMGLNITGDMIKF